MILSSKRRVFVEEYLMDFNGTQAAIRAGYSKKGARVTAHRLLTNPNIQEYIQKRIEEKVMSADEVLIRLGDQARASIADIIQPLGKTFIIPIDEIMEHGHLIKKIKHTKNGIEIELYNSQRALELIGKHQGLFVDRHELSGPDGDPIAIDFGTTTESELVSRLLAPSTLEDKDKSDGEDDGQGATETSL